MKMENQVSVPVFELRPTPDTLDNDTIQTLGETSLFIRRIVSVDGVPMANADMYLPGRFAGTFTREEAEKRTIYQIYQDKLGMNLGKGRQIIRAAGASDDIAKSLCIEPGSPVLQIERKAYDDKETLIEYMILTYEASKYCFEVELALNRRQ